MTTIDDNSSMKDVKSHVFSTMKGCKIRRANYGIYTHKNHKERTPWPGENVGSELMIMHLQGC